VEIFCAEEVKRDYNKKNIIYVHKDRKIPKFSGHNIPVEDWIEDVSTILYSRDMTRQEVLILFILI